MTSLIEKFNSAAKVWDLGITDEEILVAEQERFEKTNTLLVKSLVGI